MSDKMASVPAVPPLTEAVVKLVAQLAGWGSAVEVIFAALSVAERSGGTGAGLIQDLAAVVDEPLGPEFRDVSPADRDAASAMVREALAVVVPRDLSSVARRGQRAVQEYLFDRLTAHGDAWAALGEDVKASARQILSRISPLAVRWATSSSEQLQQTVVALIENVELRGGEIDGLRGALERLAERLRLVEKSTESLLNALGSDAPQARLPDPLQLDKAQLTGPDYPRFVRAKGLALTGLRALESDRAEMGIVMLSQAVSLLEEGSPAARAQFQAPLALVVTMLGQAFARIDDLADVPLELLSQAALLWTELSDLDFENNGLELARSLRALALFSIDLRDQGGDEASLADPLKLAMKAVETVLNWASQFAAQGNHELADEHLIPTLRILARAEMQVGVPFEETTLQRVMARVDPEKSA